MKRFHLRKLLKKMTTEKGERVTVQEGKMDRKKLPRLTNYQRLKTEEAPKIVEQVLELDQDRIVK